MLLPDGVRLADDPYGAAFGHTRLSRVLLLAKPVGQKLVMSHGLGTWISYMQVRTRVLDDVVRAFVASRERPQLVLLGAGYDCRALRLRELARVPVFEVDHPTTQAHKREVLDKLGATSHAHYLTWDFETRPMAELPDALARAGLDRTSPVLTIWEGVTMYLTEGAIDASLRAIRAWSAPGSQLAMTYFAKDRIDTPSLASKVVASFVKSRGEPFRWGSTRKELAPFLAARGFTVEVDRSINDAAHELLPEKLAAIVRGGGSRYAVAS
jgi:methyltransferase (TIGR00027 family)